jgi:SagB-type dehydrogenase family enzyme
MKDDDPTRTLGPDLLNAAVYTNSYKNIVNAATSTGFRTGGLRHRTLSGRSSTRLAEDFLVNTRLRRHDRESESSVLSYFTDQGIATLALLGHEEAGGLPELALPPSVSLSMELGEIVRRRRSCRRFTGDTLRLAYLATILRCAGGISTHHDVSLARGGHCTLGFRTVASGGGLYPLEIYVLAVAPGDFPPGLYKYLPIGDRLVEHGDASIVPRILRTFAVPDDVISVSRAAAIVFLVGLPWRSMRKYGNRGMRFLFIEAGATSQNIHLAAQALGFGTVDCASIFDDEAHEAMSLDGTFESLLHTVIIGYPGE